MAKKTTGVEISDSLTSIKDMSSRMNQLVETINEKIETVNSHLVGCGIELWLTDQPIDFDQCEHFEVMLGYGRYAKRGFMLLLGEHKANSITAIPLTDAKREYRLKALTLIPKLLEEIKATMTRQLKELEQSFSDVDESLKKDLPSRSVAPGDARDGASPSAD